MCVVRLGGMGEVGEVLCVVVEGLVVEMVEMVEVDLDLGLAVANATTATRAEVFVDFVWGVVSGVW